MGLILSRVGASIKYTYSRLDRNSKPADSDAALHHQHFEAAVIKASEAGDLPMLKHLNEQESLLFWGGIDQVASKPPLLHRVVAKGHKPVVEYLLQLGLDVDETDTSGLTPIHIACKVQHNSCLPPLITGSCDIDKRDVWGRTPLIKALVYRNVEAAKMLLSKGANPNATDIYGMTPLTTAIDYDMMDVLALLVSHGADVNLITHHHHGLCSGPPLYLAINNQNLPMVQQLLRLGAATQPRVQDYFYNNNSNNASSSSSSSSNTTTPWNYIGLGNGNTTTANNNNNNNNTNTSTTTTTTNTNYPTSSLSPSLQHSDAVSLCIYEIVRHGDQHQNIPLSQSSSSRKGTQILLEVLGAHGYSLGPAPDILIRLLLNNNNNSISNQSEMGEDFMKLLYKLQICTSSGSEDILLRMALLRKQSLETTTHHQQRGGFEEEEEEERGGRGGGGGGRREGRRGGVGNHNNNNRSSSSTANINQLMKQPPRLVSSLQNQARRVARKALMNSHHNVVWACCPLQCPPALKTLLLLKDVDRAFNPCRPEHDPTVKVKVTD